MTKQQILEELNELIHDSPVKFPVEAMQGLKDALKYIEGVSVYSVEEGHGRVSLLFEDGTYTLLFGVSEEYAEPGTITQKDEPVKLLFGYKLRDAEHARILAAGLERIAGVMEKGVAEMEETDGADNE